MHAFPRFVAVCLSVSLAASVAVAKTPIKKLKYDPSVPPVGLFDAIEAGTVETSVIARNPHEATLFVTNKSDAPVSVKMPQAVVAVQVLKQQLFGQNRGGNLGQGMAGGGMMGGAQTLGAGMQNGQGVPGGMNNFQANGNNGLGNGNGNGFNNNGIGPGFFSVPPQKTVQVPLQAVCLQHGKPDPRPKMTYKLVKLEDYTNDPALQETLKRFTAGETDLQTAQAAVWHLTDKMSWNELREKQVERVGLEPVSYFSDKQMDDAQALIEQVREKVGNSTSRRSERAAR